MTTCRPGSIATSPPGEPTIRPRSATCSREDAEYRYHPWDDPISGRDAIVADWLESPDAAGTWEAQYEPYAIDGDRASAIGTSRYTNPDGSLRTLYYNHWTLRFDGQGRCIDFVEYFMELPERLRASH